MAKIDAATIIRFGLFEIDLARGALTRQGVRLRIQEQPFRILELLLRESGEIVNRETLRQARWPGTARSRENAKSIREPDVTHAVRQ